MKRALKLALMVAIAMGAGIGVTMAVSNHDINNPTVKFRTGVENWAFLDVNTDSNIEDEVVMHLSLTRGEFATNKGAEPRSQIAVERLGTGDDAKAWLKGSGGGEVRADEKGNVIILLGN